MNYKFLITLTIGMALGGMYTQYKITDSIWGRTTTKQEWARGYTEGYNSGFKSGWKNYIEYQLCLASGRVANMSLSEVGGMTNCLDKSEVTP
jgi:hypothetical protein